MSGLRFQDPIWLLLVLLVLAAVVFDVRRRQRVAVLYSSVQVLKTLPRTAALRAKKLLPPVRFLGLALVAAALARPQQGQQEFRIRAEGIAIQMVCDCSGSMQAMDFEEDGNPADRLSAVKRVFRDFVAGTGELPGRPNDLIGLVAFGGYPDSKCPLTLDHGALLEILGSLEVPAPVTDARGRVINQGLLEEELATAIGDALALGVARLKDAKAKSKVAILLSDGVDNFSVVPPLQAAEAAATYGIKVYAIGIGSGRELVPFPRTDMFGKRVLVSERIPLDEGLLTEIAEKTGGKYFNARDTDSLVEVYKEIDSLEKTETEGLLYMEYRELFQLFLVAGVGLVVLEVILSATRFRTLP